MSILLPVAAAFLVAGFVKGVVGSGLPTIAIGLLGSVLPPSQAAALIVLPSLVTNIWQSAGSRLGILLRRIGPMLVGICAGAWLGSGLITGANGENIRIALGGTLIIYAVIGLVKLRLHVTPRAEPLVAPLVGIATGVLAAATGVFAIPSGPYLQAIGLDKDDFVQALGITYTVSTVALALTLAHGGALPLSMAIPALLALAGCVIGMLIGQATRKWVAEETFRKLFFISMLVIGGHLVLRGIL